MYSYICIIFMLFFYIVSNLYRIFNYIFVLYSYHIVISYRVLPGPFTYASLFFISSFIDNFQMNYINLMLRNFTSLFKLIVTCLFNNYNEKKNQIWFFIFKKNIFHLIIIMPICFNFSVFFFFRITWIKFILFSVMDYYFII